MELDDLAHVIDPSFTAGLDALSVGELRARRAACQAVEARLSYLRRHVQVRLDLVRTERSHRERPGERRLGDRGVEDLVDELPEALAAPAARHRGMVLSTEPPDDPGLLAELEAVCSGDLLAIVPSLPVSQLDGLVTALEALEEEVSGRRRAVFGQLDRLTAELTERYRTGTARVDDLLDGVLGE